jgi:hypothetical protein
MTEHTLQATAHDGSKLRVDVVIGRSTVVNKAHTHKTKEKEREREREEGQSGDE